MNNLNQETGYNVLCAMYHGHKYMVHYLHGLLTQEDVSQELTNGGMFQEVRKGLNQDDYAVVASTINALYNWLISTELAEQLDELHDLITDILYVQEQMVVLADTAGINKEDFIQYINTL